MHCFALGAQEKVLGDIQGYYKEKDCVLLQGVTSSGKTEIYIHLIQETLRQGKQCCTCCRKLR